MLRTPDALCWKPGESVSARQANSGTTLGGVPEWITHEQAASILGCHVSNVPKLIRKGS